MRYNKYTWMFIFLAIASNSALSLWLKQGILGVATAITFLLLAAWTTKQPNTDKKEK